LPALAAVHRLPQSVGGEIKNVRVDRREDDWLSAQHAVIRRAERLGRDLLRLVGATVIARKLAAIDNVRIERIRHHVTIFFRGDGMPIAEGDFAVISAAGNARRTAFLLAAAHAVRESIIGVYVVHLRGGLVVPGTPCLAAVYGNDCALIADQ